ncbi:DDB1- and CUL4-associated factor 12 [Armadillidium vulgare]|nr:DDB1- and CUL4-associated factor 12 [Armadillidium vulgare]
MATTKIPTVYGSKPCRRVPKHMNCRKWSLTNLNKAAGKNQAFTRYHFEVAAFHNIYPNEDPYASPNFYEEGDDLDSNIEDQIFPIHGSSCEKMSINLSLHRRRGFNFDSLSYNFTDYINQRSQGLCKTQFQSINNEFGAHRMIQNQLFKENRLNLKNVNKVFCSKWLTNDQIVMGTKCNQLLLYNVSSQKVDNIPILSGPSCEAHHVSDQCGIHALEVNPSKTLMATGAQNSNEIAVYNLPTLDPVCVGENAHLDWVFDLSWLDDQFLVSASRDKSMAIWRVDESLCCPHDFPTYSTIKPLCVKDCVGADKVRALLFNPNYFEIVALSLNAKIHVWDATIFKQVMSQELEIVNENVCLTKTENCSMYAVGSKSHVTLIDPRTLQSISKIDTRKSGPNIRSLSFRGALLTIGTGTGDILFYDVNAGRYIEGNEEGPVDLKCSKCAVTFDESAPLLLASDNSQSDSAVYTHCYDWSGTRLFAAGGPLSAAYKGCYASLWC